LWGIRDRGITWARYQPDYMDARTVGHSIVFSYAGATPEPEGYAYRLVPVDRLQTAFDDIKLTKNDRQAIFENSRHWLSRLFGSNNGSSGKLLVPPPRSADRNSIGFDRFASTERGFMVGAQLNAEQQGAFVGARYAFLLGDTWVPDIMFQADALFVGTTYLSSQIMISYPIDGSRATDEVHAGSAARLFLLTAVPTQGPDPPGTRLHDLSPSATDIRQASSETELARWAGGATRIAAASVGGAESSRTRLHGPRPGEGDRVGWIRPRELHRPLDVEHQGVAIGRGQRPRCGLCTGKDIHLRRSRQRDRP
jgi:hypothetical protein